MSISHIVFFQGIAVNADMSYTLLRSSNDQDVGTVIVATERMEALKDVLEPIGLNAEHGEILGQSAVHSSFFCGKS